MDLPSGIQFWKWYLEILGGQWQKWGGTMLFFFVLLTSGDVNVKSVCVTLPANACCCSSGVDASIALSTESRLSPILGMHASLHWGTQGLLIYLGIFSHLPQRTCAKTSLSLSRSWISPLISTFILHLDFHELTKNSPILHFQWYCCQSIQRECWQFHLKISTTKSRKPAFPSFSC